MTLSDAIRLGAMLKPQAFGGMLKDGGTCALGAAADALGCLHSAMSPRCEIVTRYPWLSIRTQTVCPACSYRPQWFDTVIAHLNDEHHWTREQIADWVATVEAAQATEAPASVSAVDPVGDDAADRSTRGGSSLSSETCGVGRTTR